METLKEMSETYPKYEKFIMNQYLPINLVLEIWQRGAHTSLIKRVVIKHAYDYHRLVADEGYRDDVDIYLRLRNAYNGKYLDDIIIHSSEIKPVHGFNHSDHYDMSCAC